MASSVNLPPLDLPARVADEVQRLAHRARALSRTSLFVRRLILSRDALFSLACPDPVADDVAWLAVVVAGSDPRGPRAGPGLEDLVRDACRRVRDGLSVPASPPSMPQDCGSPTRPA